MTVELGYSKLSISLEAFHFHFIAIHFQKKNLLFPLYFFDILLEIRTMPGNMHLIANIQMVEAIGKVGNFWHEKYL